MIDVRVHSVIRLKSLRRYVPMYVMLCTQSTFVNKVNEFDGNNKIIAKTIRYLNDLILLVGYPYALLSI